MGIFKLLKLLPELFIYVYRGLSELCFAPSHDGIKSGRRELRNAIMKTVILKQSVQLSDVKPWNHPLLFQLFGCKDSSGAQKNQDLLRVALTWPETLSNYSFTYSSPHQTNCLLRRPCVFLHQNMTWSQQNLGGSCYLPLNIHPLLVLC